MSLAMDNLERANKACIQATAYAGIIPTGDNNEKIGFF